MDDVTVERSVTLGASPEEVWENVVEGALAGEWMGAPISIDPRPGGKVDFAPDGTPYLGTVEEVDPGRSITWSWRHPDRDPSQVTITVEPDGGGARLTVTERLLPYTITDARDLRPPVDSSHWLPEVSLAA
ncbi:MAG TPA: SRPBCC family protein [Acidimicrobiia bacterium]